MNTKNSKKKTKFEKRGAIYDKRDILREKSYFTLKNTALDNLNYNLSEQIALDLGKKFLNSFTSDLKYKYLYNINLDLYSFIEKNKKESEEVFIKNYIKFLKKLSRDNINYVNHASIYMLIVSLENTLDEIEEIEDLEDWFTEIIIEEDFLIFDGDYEVNHNILNWAINNGFMKYFKTLKGKKGSYVMFFFEGDELYDLLVKVFNNLSDINSGSKLIEISKIIRLV